MSAGGDLLVRGVLEAYHGAVMRQRFCGFVECLGVARIRRLAADIFTARAYRVSSDSGPMDRQAVMAAIRPNRCVIGSLFWGLGCAAHSRVERTPLLSITWGAGSRALDPATDNWV